MPQYRVPVSVTYEDSVIVTADSPEDAVRFITHTDFNADDADQWEHDMIPDIVVRGDAVETSGD